MCEEFIEFQIQTDETPETMEMTFDELVELIRAEHNERLDQLLADFERLVNARLPGQAVQVQSAFDITNAGSPLRVYVIVSLRADGETSPTEPTPPPESPEPPRIPPPLPSLTGQRRMAARVYEKALLFWWSEPPPGMIYVLWLDSGQWESLTDASPADQAGFEWLAQRVDLGRPEGDEMHGDGQVLAVAEGAWLLSPVSHALYFLWSDGTWQPVEV